MRVRSSNCNATRERISIGLDVDLSAFERALVRTHLDRCLECARFAAELRGFTAALRETELEPLPAPVAIPRRGRRLERLTPAASVALAAAVFLGVALLPARIHLDTSGERALLAAPLTAAVDPNVMVREVRRSRMERQQQQQQQPEASSSATGGLGAVKPPLPASPR